MRSSARADGLAGLHVYLDVDDVLAETTRALVALARTRFGKRVDFEQLLAFDLAVSLGLDAREHAQFMEEAHAEDFLLGLEPLPGAAEAVAAWHRAGAEISVVTGRPPASLEVTGRWLARAGIAHHRVEVVDKYGRYPGSGAPHREDLLERGFAFVIEDSLEMAELFAAQGDARVLLVDRPWNRAGARAHPRVRRVRDWSEIGAALDAWSARADAGGD